MKNSQGYTVVEVLISLLIISGLCINLLLVNWQISRRYSRALEQVNLLVAKHNQQELLRFNHD